jgi:polysaccharide export outer membrane protein
MPEQRSNLSPWRAVRGAAVLAAAWVFLCPEGSAIAQQRRASPPATRPAPSPTPPPSPTSADAGGYVIGAGDVLMLHVWKEQDLTREVNVRIDGKITVPLLGDVQAAGRTPSQLSVDLAKGLEKYIEAPQVVVAIKQPVSYKYFMLGEVARPGDMPLNVETTLLQAIAQAGGLKEFAKSDKITIIRQDKSVLVVNFKKLQEGKDMEQNIVIKPGDTIIVP